MRHFRLYKLSVLNCPIDEDFISSSLSFSKLLHVPFLYESVKYSSYQNPRASLHVDWLLISERFDDFYAQLICK